MSHCPKPEKKKKSKIKKIKKEPLSSYVDGARKRCKIALYSLIQR